MSQTRKAIAALLFATIGLTTAAATEATAATTSGAITVVVGVKTPVRPGPVPMGSTWS